MFSDAVIGAVVSPALGGVIIGQEVARALPEPKGIAGRGVPALFAERDASGTMTLRRGFSLQPDEHVLVIEDVWTTGGSTQETIQVVEEAGGRVVAAGALIDRSAGTLELGVETQALLDLPIAKVRARGMSFVPRGRGRDQTWKPLRAHGSVTRPNSLA